MRKLSFVSFILFLLSFINPNPAFAYGPFVLPIHDNNVKINGGAWNYSVSCSAAQYEIDYYPLQASHGGYDFDGDEGDSVYAAASGVVSDIQNSNCPNTYPNGDPNWGCYVDIKHDVDGDGNYDYTTKYTHLVSGSITVAIGNSVNSNTVIGQLGNSGYSSGAHLHFGIQNYNWAQYLDNSYWLDPYNLDDDNATCCDIPNGCPNEGTSSQHPDFNCNAASDSDYLWASCPPTYDAEVSTCSTTSTYDIRMVKVSSEDVLRSYYHSSNKLHEYGEVGTASSSDTVNWQVADMNADGYDDLIHIAKTSAHTYAWVYLATGNGGFYAAAEWKRTGTKAKYAFVGDQTGDGKADLILGYKLENLASGVATDDASKIVWKVCPGTGATFNDCTTWTTDSASGYTDSNSNVLYTYGDGSTDVFRAGDLDGDGKVEILRGREESSTSCSGKLKWKRLNTDNTTEVIDNCWAYPSSQFIVTDVDDDNKDEIVQVRTSDSEVEVFIAHYKGAENLTTESWANDVGNTDGWYYLADMNYDSSYYPDLIRYGTSSLKFMSNSGTSFQESDNAQTLLSDFGHSSTASKDDYRPALLFGTFGDYQVTSSCTSTHSTTSSTATGTETSDNDGLIDEDVTPEDQYIFFDYDGNGDDDPCVRRGTGLLCLYDGLYGTWTVPGEVIGTGEYLITREGRTSYYDYMGADGIADYVLVYGETWADEFLYWHHTIVARFGNQLQIDRNLDGIMDTYLYYGAGNTEDGYYLADLNGDGYADFIVRRGNLFYVDSTSDGAADYWFTYGSTSLDSQWYFADFDGDGVDGILVIRGDVLTVVDTITPNQANTADWVMAYGFGLAD